MSRRQKESSDFERYLEYIREPVVILDRLDQIMALNAAFSSLFPRVRRGQTIRMFEAAYPVLERFTRRETASGRLSWNGREYAAHTTPIRYPGRLDLSARCVVLSDITETAVLVRETDKANAALAASNETARRQNEEIREHIRLEEQTAIVRETGVLLRDLHDTLGHTLTLLNALHKLALSALGDEEACRRELREALRLTRIAEAELYAAGGPESGLPAFFERFRESMARVDLEVATEISGGELPCHRYLYVPLTRICQEAATNAIRHGNATRLDVRLDWDEKTVALYLGDNGSSPPGFRKGNGLIGVEERVNDLFGSVDMGKADDGGFFIDIRLPVIEDE